MILDSINNAAVYAALSPCIIKGLNFISQNAATIPAGKYFLDGDKLFVMVVETELRDASQAFLEAHREYVDVQVVLEGEESFAWASTDDCQMVRSEYDMTNDIIFFEDAPSTLIKATQGQFLVFYPQDAHAPLIGVGKVRKAVIKVKVNQ